MEKLPNGVVTIVNLPGSGSLISRSWRIYTHHFNALLGFSLLMALGTVVNGGLASFLNYTVREGSEAARSLIQVGVSGINLLAAYFFAFVFSGIVTFLDSLKKGAQLSLAQALEQGQEHTKSVFWVAVLLVLMLYASLPTGIFFVVFSIWFYFALYVVVVSKQRGVNALAMSRYLIHGLFFKSFGRYIAVIAILLGFLSVSYLTLGIPAAGPYIFSLLFALMTLFSFPFFVTYEYLRFEDLLAVQRTIEFHPYRGERAAIIAWTLAGCIFFGLIWLMNLLPLSSQKALGTNLSRGATTLILPYAAVVQENLQAVSTFFNKLTFPGIQSVPTDTDSSAPPTFDENPFEAPPGE